MSQVSHRPQWRATVNAKITRVVPRSSDAGRVAAMFGLADGQCETFYENLRLAIAPGQIVAVIGPSGAGKSMFLRAAAAQVGGVRWLRTGRLSVAAAPAVEAVGKAPLAERLAMLSRCGLADAAALVTPAKLLSGGQLYRLALAKVLLAARNGRGPALVVADEFAATLDTATAETLCRTVRKLISASACSLLLATPRQELLAVLRPDQIILKRLGEPGRLAGPGDAGQFRCPDPLRWPIRAGTIHDYRRLAGFHYLAGAPAAHKRVYVIRPPAGAASGGAPEVAGVLVVSPPVFNVRGRNLATGGRYAGADRRTALAALNADIECISRVIVHPIYRGCGLAVRLVRRAIAGAATPMVEALAAMGAVHPFFTKAGMETYEVGLDVHLSRLVSAAEAVGLTADDLAAVAPVRRFLSRRTRRSRFLKREIDCCIARTLCAKRLSRLSDPVAEVCRRTGRQYVYYLARKSKEDEK